MSWRRLKGSIIRADHCDSISAAPNVTFCATITLVCPVLGCPAVAPIIAIYSRAYDAASVLKQPHAVQNDQYCCAGICEEGHPQVCHPKQRQGNEHELDDH